MDEKKIGITPVEIPILSDGNHLVRIEKSKHKPHKQEITVQKGNPVTLDILLLPETYGDLQVSSSPSAAILFVDGVEIGETPTTIEHLSTGFHQLTIRKSEFQLWEKKVEITLSGTGIVTANLTPVYGSLQITSSPDKATVFIDGLAVGKTPFSSIEIREGLRDIKLVVEGYDPWTRQKTISQSAPVVLHADLKTPFGSLFISSTPNVTHVYLDGKAKGTTPLVMEKIKPGFYRLELKQDDYLPWIKKIFIKAGERYETSANLRSIPVDTSDVGSLTVYTEPPHAAVRLVDNEASYKAGMQLKAGTYTIEVSETGYDSKLEKISVLSGKNNKPFVEISISEADFIPEKTYKDPVTGMVFIFVEGGCYSMGDIFEEGDNSERPIHKVCVNNFWMGKYEVTQEEYEKIMGTTEFGKQKGGRLPAARLFWKDTQRYIAKLSAKSEKTFRLPTEAEWEYTARSRGRKERFAGSNTIDEVAWYSENSNRTIHPVGLKKPNGLGFYDMTGNAAEWCLDWFGYNYKYYQNSPVDNPQGAASGGRHVARGGHRGSWVTDCRNTYRTGTNDAGFRLVFE